MDLNQQLEGMDSLRRFRDWWFAELAAAVPRRLRELMSPSPPRLSVIIGPGHDRFVLLEQGEEREVAALDLQAAADAQLDELRDTLAAALPPGVAVQVFLPPELVLEHRIALPLATESNLASVVQFEIDRLTPFRPHQASLGYRVERRVPEQSMHLVALYVVEQTLLDRLLDRLAYLRLEVEAVFPTLVDRAGPAPDASSGLNMLHPKRRPPPEPLFNRAARQWAGLCAVLLVAVLAFPAWQSGRQIAALEEEIASIASAAGEVGSRRAELLNRIEVQRVVSRRKNDEPGKLQLLDDLTRLLPDDTWVMRLDIAPRGIALQGESRNASHLIELLEQAGRFQDVAFGSPVTRDPKSGLERYELRMQLEAADD